MPNHINKFMDVFSKICYIFGMAENKKQLRKVTVAITDGRQSGEDVYRIVVPENSTTQKEMDWRMEFLEGIADWTIMSDELVREV